MKRNYRRSNNKHNKHILNTENPKNSIGVRSQDFKLFALQGVATDQRRLETMAAASSIRTTDFWAKNVVVVWRSNGIEITWNHEISRDFWRFMMISGDL